jgi:hypothetical protein
MTNNTGVSLRLEMITTTKIMRQKVKGSSVNMVPPREIFLVSSFGLCLYKTRRRVFVSYQQYTNRNNQNTITKTYANSNDEQYHASHHPA